MHKSLFFSVLFFAAPAFACDCIDAGAFVKASSSAQLVAKVKVKEYGPVLGGEQNTYQFMRVLVLEVLAGRQNTSQVLVYGDVGNLCRPYITPNQFTLGAEYVMALNHIEEKAPRSYQLSICGTYWLSVVNGNVVGRISNDVDEVISYESFRELFTSQKR